MKKHLFTAALAVLAVAACSKENLEEQGKETEEVRGIEVSANVLQATKTTIDGVNVLWAKGDRIGFVADGNSVVDGSSFYAIRDEFDGKQSATITVPIREGVEVTDETQIAFTANYPYSETTSDGTQVIEIAAEQDGQTGKWGQMSAKFSGTKAELVKNGLTFTHECAYIDFQFKSSELNGCPVTKVMLTSLDEDKHFTGKTILKVDGLSTESYNRVSVSDPVAGLSTEWQGKLAVVAPVDLTGTKVKIDITYTKDGAPLTQTKVIDGSNLQAGHKVTLKLNLDKTDFNVISFEDTALGEALATAFGSDGFLTVAQAAAVTDNQMSSFISSTLPKGTSIKSFHEFQFFTGLKKTPNFWSNNVKIGKITLPPKITTISFNSFRGTNLSEIYSTHGVEIIEAYAFYECKQLKNIDLSSVTAIGQSAFQRAINLESVGDTPKLKNVFRYAFSGCSNLKSINLSNLLTAEEYAFASCGVESVDLRNLTSAGNNMFDGCIKLTSVGSLKNLTRISDCMFKDCRTLPMVSYLTENIGIYAFQNCNALEVTNEQLKIVKTIGNGGFNNCTKIAGEISLPNIESIGSTAFEYSGITSIDLAGAPITEIGQYAFSNMNALKKITISANVSKLGANIFYNSKGLAEIHMLSATPATLDTNTFADTSDNYIIYVPKGCAETYKAAEGWSTYADRIKEEQ